VGILREGGRIPIGVFGALQRAANRHADQKKRPAGKDSGPFLGSVIDQSCETRSRTVIAQDDQGHGTTAGNEKKPRRIPIGVFGTLRQIANHSANVAAKYCGFK
jgi:hypothetical protein